ncbi:hypothetical protein CAEBREN_06548 [Caenorhabditis brenneri]|uniref:Uncharacterized protein n=1 Tax=Caenorhabditis brenneri TaxID=135651 RepID=G0N3N0_CAEBE|nr:hypothetical protein CAEBREN_06548 [Caenorhabditis brenneri]
MKFQLVFLLAALIGTSQAQGLPGVICGITGILCPPTTVAPTTTTTTVPTTTTASETEEICFTIPGNNVNIVIDPAQLTQIEVDQIKQLVEDSLANILGSFGGTINGALNGLVGGLTGILNPATTPTPTGDGQICVVIPNSDIDELEAFLEDVFSRLTAFFNCLKDLEETTAQFQAEVDRVRMEIDTLVARFNNCDIVTCYLGVANDAYELVRSLPARFLTYPNTVRDDINQCVTETINA